MDNQSFLVFVKWYFDLVSDKFYGRHQMQQDLTYKKRKIDFNCSWLLYFHRLWDVVNCAN